MLLQSFDLIVYNANSKCFSNVGNWNLGVGCVQESDRVL